VTEPDVDVKMTGQVVKVVKTISVVMTSEGVGIAGGDDDAGATGELDEPAGGVEAGRLEAGGLDAGLEDPGGLDNGGLDAGDDAGGVDPGGAGMNEEMEKVPVRGRVLDEAGGPLGRDETGQIVVEIAIVEVTTIVE
jgi:hypothetical protein